jgi:hypothetical protein
MPEMPLNPSIGPNIQFGLDKGLCQFWLEPERVSAKVNAFFPGIGVVGRADANVGWNVEFTP